MSFPLNSYLAALMGAALVAAASVPFWRAQCRRIGLVDAPGHRKIHAQPTPLAGGLAIWTALTAAMVGLLVILQWGWLDANTTEKLRYGLAHRAGQLLAILGGASAMLVLGALDDKFELSAGVKFAGQLLIAGGVALAGIRITLFVPSVLFSYFITILWILTVINAFNFMDNMNGLCAGLALIATVLLGLRSAAQGQYLVAGISFATAGSLLGFLPYNFPRATAFLGDAGSHLIGFLVAVLAILPHFYTRKHPNPWAVLDPLLILALPLADLCWVVGLRWKLGKPFYIGDTNHLSHRLVGAGLTPTRAVACIWLGAAGVGALIFLLK